MNHLSQRLLTFLLALVAGLQLAGCPEDNPVTPPDDDFNETVLEEKTATVGVDGGAVTLADGATVRIPSGAVAGETKITFRKIGGERYFDASNRNAYELVGTVDPAEVTLVFPGSPGGTEEDFGILNYNPETMEGEEIPFMYDPVSGNLTVLYTPNGTISRGASASKRAAGLNDRSRWVTEKEPLVEPDRRQNVIEIPFYQQDELTCWATGIKMLTRAYNPEASSQVFDYLRYAGYPPTQGPNAYMYRLKVPSALRVYADGAATGTMYWRESSAFNNLVAQLDSGRVVLMGRNNHSFVVIGYEKITQLRGPSSYRFLVHDPADENTGNAWKEWSWLANRTYADLTMTEIWIPKPPAANRGLQSVGLPLSGATGWIRFVKEDDQGSTDILGVLQFNTESSTGYGWKHRTSWVGSIAGDATSLQMQLPLWNADRSKDASVSILTSIRQRGEGETYSSHEFRTLPVGTGATEFDLNIPVSEFRKSENDSVFTLKVELLNASSVAIDRFSVDFTLGPGGPQITSISPDHGKKGESVEIIGKNFGDDRSKGSVTFGGTEATSIASWSDTRITATIPEGASTGDVIVTVAGTESNGYPFTVDDDIDILGKLRTSIVGSVQFYGLHSLADGTTLSDISISSSETGLPLEWSGNAFSAARSWKSGSSSGGYREYSISFSGNVSADGKKLERVEAIYHETWVAPDEAWTQITTKELTFTNLRFYGLFPSLDNDDIEILQYFEYGEPLRTSSMKAVYKITVDNETVLEYTGSDWDNPFITPEADVAFARYKN